VYVLSGRIEVDVNGSTSALAVGDAIHFRADMTHALRNPHEEVATVLVVNALEGQAPHPSHGPQRSGRHP
jgi:quercetin dioxygenase-like cupin family protein